ncbi:2-succinyl-5-enolpyruvyl-6-hydroxy-3-cyclohexene-1-carboxylic-acid synthase [uncultured Croceitalea sp.]|uniref:2-succinyl-5-enolpyruvyl-6-hydroxy-3- cyclohexene-1-carboxylic-acid synthase n=1 Tax=uncultured Croceitalea sp. TaxID=1798908 RepID=UPI00330604B4
MKQSIIPSAQTVVSACKGNGVKNIVISPGSRSAPLTISFTQDSFFKCFSIVDERSAAFFALGMALQQKQPVAVVCTSGSALLNYYPAISEAFYSTIPLVVISADRPPYKIDVGDGQTIRQDHVFQRHIGYSANLKLDVVHAKERIERYAPDMLGIHQDEILSYNQDEVRKALSCATEKHLPVHINVPFEEPLYDVEDLITEEWSDEITTSSKSSDVANMYEFKALWGQAKRKLVLVGVNYPDEVEQSLLDVLANDPSVIVMTETTSNLHHPNFFASIDSIIFPIEKSNTSDTLFKALQPEILLTFGGLIVSKKVKAFLRQYQPKQHWHVDKIKAYDTYFSLTHHFKTDANGFLAELLSDGKPVLSEYFSEWSAVKKRYEAKRGAYLAKIPFSDFLVFHDILDGVPDKYQVHLANSSTVRYAQLFNSNPTLKIFCNRGTSGIDGSTSTAVGAAFYENAPTLLITGDLSFFYDSNALWNNYLRNDFRIILINNGGGGIFRILPGNDGSENFETYFETVQQQNAQHLCLQFGFEYQKCNTAEALKGELSTFYSISSKPKVLEITTPRKQNNKILLDYFDFIS